MSGTQFAPESSIRNHPARLGLRTTAIGIAVNAALAATKGLAGFFGNSYALIADAIESTSDIFSSIIVFGGLKIAAAPRDQDHPYGHGKAEPLAAMVISLTLFFAAAIISYQSIKEIITPHHAPEPYTLFVLLGVIITKEVLFRYVFSAGSAVRSTAMQADAWHHRSDALTSTAAFIGISIALIGGRGYESADDWAALCAATVIIYNAIRLLKTSVNEVMDHVPAVDLTPSIRTLTLTVKGVSGVDKCYVRKMGFEYYIDIHVEVDGSMTVWRGHEIGHEVKDLIMRNNPRIADVLVHIEPVNNPFSSRIAES